MLLQVILNELLILCLKERVSLDLALELSHFLLILLPLILRVGHPDHQPAPLPSFLLAFDPLSDPESLMHQVLLVEDGPDHHLREGLLQVEPAGVQVMMMLRGGGGVRELGVLV